MNGLTLESLAKRVEAWNWSLRRRSRGSLARIGAESSACSATANSDPRMGDGLTDPGRRRITPVTNFGNHLRAMPGQSAGR